MIQCPIPQDILKYKPKFALNLTTRQCVCYGLGCAIGGLAFLVSSGFIESTGAKVVITIIFAAPFFAWSALSDLFGVPFEKFVIPFLIDNFIAPTTRYNEVHYGEIEEEIRQATKIRSTRKRSKKKEAEILASASKEYVAIK